MDTELKEAFILSKLSNTIKLVNYKNEVLIVTENYAYPLDIVPVIMYYGSKNLIPYTDLEKIEIKVSQKTAILGLEHDKQLVFLRRYLLKNPDIIPNLTIEIGKYLRNPGAKAN